MINVTQTFFPPLEQYQLQLERIWKNKWLTNRGELLQELEEKLKNITTKVLMIEQRPKFYASVECPDSELLFAKKISESVHKNSIKITLQYNYD